MSQSARRVTRERRDPSQRRRASAPVRGGAAGQRERLIEAMVELAGQQGYQSLSIAQVSSRAGVSSATFYEQFEDKDDCLLAAYRSVTERTLARMQEALGEGHWSLAARGAFTQLLQSVQESPDAGRLMFIEAPAGGAALRAELTQVLDGVEQSAETLLDSGETGGNTLDIPARALMGAVRGVVARHLRTDSEDRLDELTEDLLGWMGSYGVAAGAVRWSTSDQALLAADARPEPAEMLPEELGPLPRGRHGLTPGMVSRSQRTRIVYATAKVTMEKGYANTTVADIVSAAGVAKEAFYRQFRDKEHAFLEAQQHATQHLLDTLVAAYFSAEQWPERIWRGLGTLLVMLAANPRLAHLRMVESYAAGGAAVRRAEDITRSFTVFLEEGYWQRPEARGLPRLCSQAISSAIFELVQVEVQAGRVVQIQRLLPKLTYIALAPFLGPAEAAERVRALAGDELATAKLA